MYDARASFYLYNGLMYEGVMLPPHGAYTEFAGDHFPHPSEDSTESPPATPKERLATTAALALLGAAASYAEYNHLLRGSVEPIKALRDSGRHPLVGYVGAAIANRHQKFNNWTGMLLAGTVADIGTEAAQAFLLKGPSDILEPLDRSQLAGNFQDYVFALGGSILWGIRSRFSKK